MALFTDAVANLRGRPLPEPAEWVGTVPSLREGSIELADGLGSSYQTIYRKQPWVFASVNKLAKSVARMPLKAYQRDGVNRQRLFDGDLARLMSRPYGSGTPFFWKERIVKNTAIYGNAILVKLGVEDEVSVPGELFPAPPVGWTVGKNDTYIWTSKTGERFPFERWRIIHFRFWDLDENQFGMSMLEPLRMTLLLEDSAQRYGAQAFKALRPGSVLKTDKELKQEGMDKLLAQMQAIHGDMDSKFKLAVLQQGLDWAPWPTPDLNDAAVIDHRKLTKEEVAAVFDVPQPTIGILDEANFASLDMLHTMLYQDSLGPWVTMIEETLQTELVDIVPAFQNQFVEFDLNAVLRGDIATRYRAYATAIQTGFKTPNEIRQLENDPPSDQEGADQLLFPTNLSGAVGAQVAEDSGRTNRQGGRRNG